MTADKYVADAERMYGPMEPWQRERLKAIYERLKAIYEGREGESNG
ncbi:hypothetical protein SEA_UKULELE_4 [Mycobacterium phage Ukulele]|uniref:Uncharacterized protein n=5 Tax=Kostyavirus TaxID=1623284 RepID=Q858A7_9CAUD|nr:gp4 [Mycobacterium phage Cjw1]AAN01619.1 hypothetical protein PBI_CJW1_4 [Mycobacterium phage Cjw1]ALA06236.1 hypothetical protein SEA_UKULELE_4 [Mycobacterium phage Ukulele]